MITIAKKKKKTKKVSQLKNVLVCPNPHSEPQPTAAHSPGARLGPKASVDPLGGPFFWTSDCGKLDTNLMQILIIFDRVPVIKFARKWQKKLT